MAIEFFWVFEPGGNVEHIAEHGLSPQDIEYAYENAEAFTVSRSSGLPAFIGRDVDGYKIFVVYKDIDTATWCVVTAYPI